MRFGDANVLDWGLGANTGGGEALRVGSSSSNGNAAYLTDGGIWTNASDRNLKSNITSLAPEDVLEKVRQLEITTWNYTGTNECHIGPMAQDFYAAFNVGLDDKHISTIDPAGVALISIQQVADEKDKLQSQVDELIKLVQTQQAQIRELQEALGVEVTGR